jgi:uncharacterized membrane protein
MNSTLKISLSVILAFAVGFMAAVSLAFIQASAHEGEDHSHEVAQNDEQNKDEEQNQDDNYKYNAQAGDTYTEMARKAVQTYGINNNVNLSQAGIVFAETQITNEAKVGLLEIGQEVEISQETVKKYVEEAQKLSEAQQKAWGYYVKFVDFNTDSVGQAS